MRRSRFWFRGSSGGSGGGTGGGNCGAGGLCCVAQTAAADAANESQAPMKTLRDEHMAILSGFDKWLPCLTRLTRAGIPRLTLRNALRGLVAAPKPDDIMRPSILTREPYPGVMLAAKGL